MYVVAIVSLGRGIDDEIGPLAANLGVTPYEAGLALRAAMPVVVLRTEEKERAVALLASLRDRGHEVIACAAKQVVASDAMTALRAFRFDDDALVALGANGVDARLAYAELLVVVRALHVMRMETVTKEKHRTISIGRAALSGGLVATKTVEKETTQRSEDREPVVYLFRRDGAPWLLRANHARYDGLGPDLRPTVLENLQTFVRVLRARAPTAAIDDRLLAVKSADPKSVDLLANVLALATARRAHAYRGA